MVIFIRLVYVCVYVCKLRVNSAVFKKAQNIVKISICIFHFSVNKIKMHIC